MMPITVRVRNLEWSEELQQQIARTIEFAVDRHKQRIAGISVYLADLNGPRGGVDKLCQISAELRGTEAVMILERHTDLMAAVHQAARRLGYRIGQRVRRVRVAGSPEHRATVRAA
jgi:putative sigma-54 modulation protein